MSQFALPANIQQVISGARFPITTDELADYAKDHGASEEILAQLRFAPGHIFKSIEDINLTYGLLQEFETKDLWSSAPGDEMMVPEEAALTVKSGNSLL